jgi:hypothetical protein
MKLGTSQFGFHGGSSGQFLLRDPSDHDIGKRLSGHISMYDDGVGLTRRQRTV